MPELDFSIIANALIAGLLVTVLHVPLGKAVLARGIIFVDIAIAQIAGLGVLIAASLHLEQFWLKQLVAVTFALAGAAFLSWSEKKWADIQEAIIGSVFVLSAAAGLIVIDSSSGSSEHLKNLLSGQIVFADTTQLIITGIVYTVLLGIWFGAIKKRNALFYYLFAITVTLSVQLIGVYLVFASLIIPAITMRFAKQDSLLVGYIISFGGYLSGLILTSLVDIPSGPAIIWCMLGLALIYLVVLKFYSKIIH